VGARLLGRWQGLPRPRCNARGAEGTRLPMAPPCQNYHLFIRSVADGLVVHPLGRPSPDGDWLLDQRLLDQVRQASPECLYVDCSRVGDNSTAWARSMLRLCRAVRSQLGKVIWCGGGDRLAEFLANTHLEKVIGVQMQEVPGGRLPLPEPSWLTWNDGTVLRLARAILVERAFDRMPVLADALEEAGCTDADILGHCRSEGPHLPDCWVLGLLTVEA
jgi:anti-anti-sigma regulatory factor